MCYGRDEVVESWYGDIEKIFRALGCITDVADYVIISIMIIIMMIIIIMEFLVSNKKGQVVSYYENMSVELFAGWYDFTG